MPAGSINKATKKAKFAPLLSLITNKWAKYLNFGLLTAL